MARELDREALEHEVKAIVLNRIGDCNVCVEEDFEYVSIKVSLTNLLECFFIRVHKKTNEVIVRGFVIGSYIEEILRAYKECFTKNHKLTRKVYILNRDRIAKLLYETFQVEKFEYNADLIKCYYNDLIRSHPHKSFRIYHLPFSRKIDYIQCGFELDFDKVRILYKKISDCYDCIGTIRISYKIGPIRKPVFTPLGDHTIEEYEAKVVVNGILPEVVEVEPIEEIEVAEHDEI